MIECYLTGILPRPKELIATTRAYERKLVDKQTLMKSFRDATLEAINSQISAGFSYVTDGMLQWHDLLRPLTENLSGVKIGSLTRWFDNNMFYRKPIIVGELWLKQKSIEKLVSQVLSVGNPKKIILPAPYTWVKLCENQYYKNKTDLMFKYAEILKEQIRSLAKIGFTYVQLSDPALVYESTAPVTSKDELNIIKDAIGTAVKGTSIQSCLQTFFGDFSRILPEVLDFPVNHLGIDLYKTNLKALKTHYRDKGIALGLVDSRSSLIEDADNLLKFASEIIDPIYSSKLKDVFICPNCDLEFLPWSYAKEKMKVLRITAKRLNEEFYG